jgi:cobalamin biosynthesis protein CobT
MSAQQVVASTLSGANVSVVFDTDVPWVDIEGKVIHLRPVPDQLSDEAIEDLRGDCDHEVGHIIHTDPTAFSVLKRQVARRVAIAIEDGRVERLVGAEWFGCGENLEKSSARAVARIAANATSDEANCRARAICGLSLISYGRLPESADSSLGGGLSEIYRPIQDLLPDVSQCGSTAEAAKLAIKITNAWSWRPTKPDNNSPSQTAETLAAKELDDSLISPATERKSSIQAMTTQAHKGAYRAKTDKDKMEAIRRPSFPIDNLYGLFFDGVRKTAPTLRRRLLMEFRSSGTQPTRLQRKGTVDGRSLWRYALEDDRLYQRKKPTKTNRSIVTILVDSSASMTRAARKADYDGEPVVFRTRLFIAAQAAAAVSATLDSLGVPNEVLAFTTSRHPVAQDLKFDRVRPLRHFVVKPFNKPYRACRSNFLSLAFFEHCSENIDGEAILWASRRMLSKPNHGDRPVLLVFSDGEPASEPENRTTLAEHLKDSIDRIEKSGIAVFGIGVGSDAVQSLYRNSVVVYAVTNLLSTFYDLLKKVMKERISLRV